MPQVLVEECIRFLPHRLGETGARPGVNKAGFGCGTRTKKTKEEREKKQKTRRMRRKKEEEEESDGELDGRQQGDDDGTKGG